MGNTLRRTLASRRSLPAVVVAAAAAVAASVAPVASAATITGPNGTCTFNSSTSGTKPTLTKANDANHDGIFNASEAVPSGATYPYVVTYQVTIDPGTAGSHCIATFGDTLVPTLAGLVSANKPAGAADCKDLVDTTIVAPNTYTCYYDVTFTAAEAQQGSIGNTVTMTWDQNLMGNNTTSNSSVVTFAPPEVLGGEGLTPGYWKQPQHFFAWQGYTQAQTFDSVFGVNTFGSLTLLGALAQGGGGAKALGRQAVAALLNAANTSIDYPLYSSQIIQLVHDALTSGNATTIENLKDQLQAYNSLSG
jgi:hypothetical protein